MTREQLIECMAKAECLHDDPKCNWEALPERHKDSYRESQAAVLDALTAAGMVVVTEQQKRIADAVEECKHDTWQCEKCGHSEPWWTDSNADLSSRAMIGANK